MVGLGDFQDTTVSFPWLRLVSGRKNKSLLFVKPKRFLTGTIANKIMQTTDGGGTSETFSAACNVLRYLCSFFVQA